MVDELSPFDDEVRPSSVRRPPGLAQYLLPAALFAMLLIAIVTWQIWRSGGDAASFEPRPPDDLSEIARYQLDADEEVVVVAGDRNRQVLIVEAADRRFLRQVSSGASDWEIDLGPSSLEVVAVVDDRVAVASGATTIDLFDGEGVRLARIDDLAPADAEIAELRFSPSGETLFVNLAGRTGASEYSAYAAETGELSMSGMIRLPAPAPVFASVDDEVVELFDANHRSLVGFVDAPPLDEIIAYDGSFLIATETGAESNREMIGYGPLGEVWRHPVPADIDKVVAIEPLGTDEWLMTVRVGDRGEVRSVARDDGAFTSHWERPGERIAGRRGGLVAISSDVSDGGADHPTDVVDVATGNVIGQYVAADRQSDRGTSGLVGPDTVAVPSHDSATDATIGRFSDGQPAWQLSGPGPRQYWLVDDAVVEVAEVGGGPALVVFGER